MKEKKLLVNNLDLFYFDNERRNLPLLMIHGNSLNSTLFNNQFQSSVLDQYQIIAPDLPGHGKSSRSKNPEKDYTVSIFIMAIIQLIKELEVEECVLFGHSLGGHIATHVIQQLTSVKGLILSGTPPLTLPPNLQEAFLPNQAMSYAFRGDLSEEEIKALAGSYISKKNNNYEMVRNSISDCDPLLRPFIGKSIQFELTVDETEILKNAGIPVALFHGENDRLINLDYIKRLNLKLWKGQPVIIKNSTHSPFLENPDDFNSILEDFLSELNE